MNQHKHEQSLRQLEQELLVREFELVEREIQLLILQQETRSKPPLRKRTGLVRRKLLDKYRSGAQDIGPPSGMHYFIIQSSCSLLWREKLTLYFV